MKVKCDVTTPHETAGQVRVDLDHQRGKVTLWSLEYGPCAGLIVRGC